MLPVVQLFHEFFDLNIICLTLDPGLSFDFLFIGSTSQNLLDESSNLSQTS